MIYIKPMENKALSIFNEPFSPIFGLGKTKEELENSGGFFIDKMPEYEIIPGKKAILKYNEGAIKISEDNEQAKIDLEANRNTLFYEYIDIIEMYDLKAENERLNEELAATNLVIEELLTVIIPSIQN